MERNRDGARQVGHASWTAALVRRIMWIGAFYALLINGRNWIPAIISSFETIGQTASGTPGIAPSDVLRRGSTSPVR